MGMLLLQHHVQHQDGTIVAWYLCGQVDEVVVVVGSTSSSDRKLKPTLPDETGGISHESW